MKHYLCMAAVVLLAGCASVNQAPVIERAPAAKKAPPKPAAAAPAAKKTAPEKDWRPDSYTVKKGDTLYSIGLEFGFDHKEVAQWNNIQPPYRIYVGQQLKLKDPKAPAVVSSVTPMEGDEAVATPLKLESAPSGKALDGSTLPAEPGSVTPAPMTSDVVPVLSEPKALKEPYSAKALADATPKPAAATTEKPAVPADKTAAPAEKPVTPDTAKPAPADDKAAPADDEAVEWSWPAKGKILAGFNDAASAKGVDIAGEHGQPVLAAAPGKVVYSGTGLRGYGKLIIIKHNKTYLSAYAHNSLLLVKEGQVITKGQKIAEMGSSDTDRVKLHFEIRKLGKPVDPAKYLPGSAE